MLSDYIEKTPGVCGGKARLKGHRIRVQDISIMSETHQMTPDEIANGLNISLAQVHAALAYYFDNIEEIREDIHQELDAVEKFKKEHYARLSESQSA